jgi:radical SAM superfamily enzyme YgiQ (UPF0313 family)
MDRILFVIPPHLKCDDFLRPAFNARIETRSSGNSFGSVLTDMPLGPMALAAYLKRVLGDLVDVRVLDFNVELNYVEEFPWDNFDEYFAKVLRTGKDRVTGESWADYDPNIIGMSVLFSPSYENFLSIAASAREVFPKAVLMAGGGVPTTMYSQIFDDSAAIDALCFAEGEKPLADYLRAADRPQYLAESTSWITRAKKDLPKCSFKPDYVVDLDEIPFGDYSVVRTEDYSLNPALTAYAGVFQKKQNFHYTTSRGCVYHCNFCASHNVNGRTMRYYSVPRVKSDLVRLRDEFGAKTIVFQDDHFMGDRNRALDIVNIIGDLGLTAVFQNSLTLFALKRPMLEAMMRAGVSQLLLSVESGSARVLREIMHKPLTLPIVEQVANDCRDLGIYTDCNILIGNIRETEADIAEGRAFLRTKCPANWFKIFIATPLVGSEFYDEAKAKGFIKGDFVNFDYKKANISTDELSQQRVEELQYELNLELNFVHNHDFRIGEENHQTGDEAVAIRGYRTALLGFLNAVKAKSDHAFGHHFAALCYDRLGEPDTANHHRTLAIQAASNPFWKKWLVRFPQVEIGRQIEPIVAATAAS